ncbi:MAG: ABC transporter permease [Ignavibacteriaceae bacterium]|nr:ABC transporter permease [Ignavibacteriaceae bacterium]
MFNNRTAAIIKRELKTKLLSKSFISMTLFIPLFMIGILGIQTYLMRYESDADTILLIAAGNDLLKDRLKEEFNTQDYVKEKKYSIVPVTVAGSTFEGFLSERKNDLLSGKISAIVHVPDSALISKKVGYYSTNPNNNTVHLKIRDVINKVLVETYFEGTNLSAKDLEYAKSRVDITGFKVSKEKEVKEEGPGNAILAFVFTFLIYFALLIIGTMMMRSVQEEKNTRVVEVLLSSVSSLELISGKIIGMVITSMVQMTIWLTPIMLLISTSWFVLPPELLMDVDFGLVLFFLYNYAISLVTFLGLFAMVGAIFSNDQDAQNGVWPVTMSIMIPFFIAMSMMSNPENTIARISSMVPIASLIVMPARVTVIEVPVWEFLLAIVVNILTAYVIFRIAAKLYRIGILRTGKSPKWNEIVKWVKFKN